MWCLRFISQLSTVYKLTAFSLALQMNHFALCLQLQQTPSLRITLSNISGQCLFGAGLQEN